jgi:hypothetical protein
MSRDQQQLLIIGAAVVGLWLYQQNQIYQAQLQPIAGASGAIGHLAGTVDTYMPTIVGAFDYWAHN